MGNGEGDPSLLAAAPHREADLHSIKGRQLPEFLASAAQTHSFPGQLNFRTKAFEVSRLSELAELGLEMASPTSWLADKNTDPDKPNQWC